MSSSSASPENSPPTETPAAGERVTFHLLQEKALELLKNPVVMAGGALVIGVAMARLSGGSKLKQVAFRLTTDLVKGKAIASLLSPILGSTETSSSPPSEAIPPADASVPPAAAQTVTPVPPAASADLLQAGKSLMQALAPQLGELAKKKLAQLFPNQR